MSPPCGAMRRKNITVLLAKASQELRKATSDGLCFSLNDSKLSVVGGKKNCSNAVQKFAVDVPALATTFISPKVDQEEKGSCQSGRSANLMV